MTGFGKATCKLSDKTIQIEIKSVNSKQADINMRMPSLLRNQEQAYRTLLLEQAERGKIDVGLWVEETAETVTTIINKEAATAYYKELKQLAKELKQNDSELLSIILRQPDVMQSKPAELSDADAKKIIQTFKQALVAFNKHRESEGKALEKDLTARVNTIAQLLKKVEVADKKRIPAIRERIQKNLEKHISKDKIDITRFEHELIFYIERNDITEEKVRLKTHCDYFIATMKEPASGRKLAFIAQELGREINTIGSKANDSDMQKLVVQMKDELEKIKEQLNNIL